MSTVETFPNGARLAVVIGAFFETFEGTPVAHPMPPLPAGHEGRYLLADSWVEYGHQVGARRLLDLLGEYELPGTFGINGLTAERAPDIVRSLGDTGHELVAHSYAQDTPVCLLSEADERVNIRRTVEAIERAAHTRPRGWISPGFQASPNTARLLAEADFLWHGDYLDRDLPYLLPVGPKPLVAVPYVNDVNDITLVVRHAQPPMAYFESFRMMFDYYRSRPSPELMVLSVTVHAHVFARAQYIPALAHVFEYLRQDPGVWVARRGDLAEWRLRGVQ